MTNTDNTFPSFSVPDTSTTPEHERPVAKTIERADRVFGVIAAKVGETRLAAGGRRYGVVFRREVGDLCLQGTFSMSLGQDELMDLMAAASTAYHYIEQLRFERRCNATANDAPFEQLEARDGWEPDHDEFFPSQIEP